LRSLNNWLSRGQVWCSPAAWAGLVRPGSSNRLASLSGSVRFSSCYQNNSSRWPWRLAIFRWCSPWSSKTRDSR
jgi:hypothetical protein